MTRYEKYFLPVYKRLEQVIVKGKGSLLYTEESNYLDMFSGLGVNVLGYGNKKINYAIKEQIKRYSHLSNYYEAESAGQLAEYLAENTFAENVFFTNSGTEAVEAGLKIIRKYGRINGRKNMITFTKAFHGRTLGSASVTEPDRSSEYNSSGIQGIITLGFNNINDLEKINSDTAGVFIEVVQGQGGINVAEKAFVNELKKRTSKYKAILMIDEIQAGMGRTGKLLAFENYEIEPDLAVIAKAIGGGLPLGALLVNKEYCGYLKPGEHGTTFGGNPVACAAGLAAIKQINEAEFLNNVVVKARFIMDEIVRLKQSNPGKIGRISGLGLMIGIEILKNEDKIQKLFEKEHVFINMTQGKILRLLPPLIITEKEIKRFIKSFEKVLKQL